jgi:precorrin-6x reductase
LAEGVDVAEVCRHVEVSVQTYQRWRHQFKAMRLEDVEQADRSAPGPGKRFFATTVPSNAGDESAQEITSSPSARRLALHEIGEDCFFKRQHAGYIEGSEPLLTSGEQRRPSLRP